MKKISKYIGVNWDNRKNKWIARVSFEGKRIFVGQFNSEEEAFKAINIKKKELNLTEQNINEAIPFNGEIFKKIDSFPDYQVSNLGRVKSLKKGKETILKLNSNGKGYLFVKFFYSEGVKKTFNLSVHQLVAIAFLGHKPNGHKVVVDHINNNTLDNRLENLQLLSHRQNISKAIRPNKKCNFTGVCIEKNGTYRASIQDNNKVFHLGTFKTKEEAKKYYQDAVKSIENGEEVIFKRRKTSSKYNGVSFCCKNKNWKSSFTLNGKTKHIGCATSEYDAYIKREEYISKLNSNQ